MARMTTKEAIEDICKRCGLSEDIVRRVQKAETEHIKYCLEHRMNAHLPGRGTYIPSVRSRLVVGGEMEEYIKTKFIVSSVISEVELIDEEYSKEDEMDELPDGIRTMQIGSLM